MPDAMLCPFLLDAVNYRVKVIDFISPVLSRIEPCSMCATRVTCWTLSKLVLLLRTTTLMPTFKLVMLSMFGDVHCV